MAHIILAPHQRHEFGPTRAPCAKVLFSQIALYRNGTEQRYLIRIVHCKTNLDRVRHRRQQLLVVVGVPDSLATRLFPTGSYGDTKRFSDELFYGFSNSRPSRHGCRCHTCSPDDQIREIHERIRILEQQKRREKKKICWPPYTDVF